MICFEMEVLVSWPHVINENFRGSFWLVKRRFFIIFLGDRGCFVSLATK